MDDYELMDILQAPTHEDCIVASFRKWITDYHANNQGITTFTFKKNTPNKILVSYKKHYALFKDYAGFEVSPTYKIEK